MSSATDAAAPLVGDELRRRLVLFAAVGAVAGLLVYVIDPGQGIGAEDGAGVITRVTMALLLGLGTGSYLFFLTAAPYRAVGAALFAVVAAVLAGGLYHWSEVRFDPADAEPTAALVLLHLVATVVAAALAAPFARRGETPRFALDGYEDWHRQAWNTPLRFLVAHVFLGGAALIVALWGALFSSMGAKALAGILGSRLILAMIAGAIIGLGFAMLDWHERLLESCRRLCLSFLSVLALVVACFAVMFGAALPFAGLGPLWATEAATPILLCLVVVSVVVVNARPPETNARRSVVGALVVALVMLLPAAATTRSRSWRGRSNPGSSFGPAIWPCPTRSRPH